MPCSARVSRPSSAVPSRSSARPATVDAAIVGDPGDDARRGAARRAPARRRRSGDPRRAAPRPARRALPGAVGVGCGRGRDRRDPRRGPRLRHEDDHPRRAARRHPAGARRRRGVLAAARRVRARRLRRRAARCRRHGAGPPDDTRAGGAALHRPRVHLQRGRLATPPVGEDGRDAMSRRCCASCSCPTATSSPPGPPTAACSDRARRHVRSLCSLSCRRTSAPLLARSGSSLRSSQAHVQKRGWGAGLCTFARETHGRRRGFVGGEGAEPPTADRSAPPSAV